MATVAHQHMSTSEKVRRRRRKDSYHLVASRNKLPTQREDEEEDPLFRYLVAPPESFGRTTEQLLALRDIKISLFRDLAASSGDVASPGVNSALAKLEELYDPSLFDARKMPRRPGSSSGRSSKQSRPCLEGMWIELSRPRYRECLGRKPNGDFMYTLGRMSFHMFRPTGLICSVQGSFNPVHVIDGQDVEAISRVPRSLDAEVRQGSNVLRSYE
jgi:hypothetical protein